MSRVASYLLGNFKCSEGFTGTWDSLNLTLTPPQFSSGELSCMFSSGSKRAFLAVGPSGNGDAGQRWAGGNMTQENCSMPGGRMPRQVREFSERGSLALSNRPLPVY